MEGDCCSKQTLKPRASLGNLAGLQWHGRKECSFKLDICLSARSWHLSGNMSLEKREGDTEICHQEIQQHPEQYCKIVLFWHINP